MKYSSIGTCISVLVRGDMPMEAVIEIQDQGPGIPDEDQPHIFDRFYRVDKARWRESGGTGLGLSIAKWAVDAHHGTIDLDSELDRGSTFRIVLPSAGATSDE